jgi:uncharacterized membrane protein HdeD (DUF308 family)
MLKDVKPDVLRILLTFAVALVGIVVVFAGFVFAIEKFGHSDNPGELVPAVLGPLTAVVGTLAGYVAGQAAGAAGKEKADERAADNQTKMQAVLHVAPEETLARARNLHPDAF